MAALGKSRSELCALLVWGDVSPSSSMEMSVAAVWAPVASLSEAEVGRAGREGVLAVALELLHSWWADEDAVSAGALSSEDEDCDWACGNNMYGFMYCCNNVYCCMC